MRCVQSENPPGISPALLEFSPSYLQFRPQVYPMDLPAASSSNRVLQFFYAKGNLHHVRQRRRRGRGGFVVQGRRPRCPPPRCSPPLSPPRRWEGPLNISDILNGGLSSFAFLVSLKKCQIGKQWKKEQASRCCTADVCLRQSMNQLYTKQHMAKLVLFSTAYK